MEATRIELEAKDIPTHWYNVVADMPTPPAPPLGPDGKPATPEQMGCWLRGVSQPHPGNVESIAGTGHWWVPLRGPGMTPPYDPRGWHGEAPSSAPATQAPASTASR